MRPDSPVGQVLYAVALAALMGALVVGIASR
ncbi:hypothetical protein ACVW19_000186 [Streptomyces sp. TE5632]